MAYVLVAWSAPEASANRVRDGLAEALRTPEGSEPIELLPRVWLYRDGDVSIDFVRGRVQAVMDAHPEAQALLTSPRRSTPMVGWVDDEASFEEARAVVNSGQRRTFPTHLTRRADG